MKQTNKQNLMPRPITHTLSVNYNLLQKSDMYMEKTVTTCGVHVFDLMNVHMRGFCVYPSFPWKL